MNDCIFCKIIDGSIPSKKVYEDTEENAAVVAHIFTKIPAITKSLGLTNGYRIVNNCGDDGCQSVKHLHFHILGGTQLNGQMA